jgi:transposase
MDQLVTMTNKEVQRYEIIKNLINQKINGTQASKQLNLSVRQAKRLKQRVKQEGIKGIIHKNRNRQSNRKLPKQTRNKIIKIIKENYLDFTSQLTYEKLAELHNIKVSYSTIRKIRIEEKLSIPRKRKHNKKYFSQRPRKDYYGELIQFDGSYHNWLENRCTDKDLKKEQCLLLAIDDATGKIVKAKLTKNESIRSVFDFWLEYSKEAGKPINIYLDKFSTYKINHKNAVDNKDLKTQFQRAMTELGIEVTFANTPQAKGRVERMNKTLQDRLIKEMRLKNITNIKDANKFIRQEFIPTINKKFSVPPRRKGNTHRKLTKQEYQDLNSIFSIKNQRIVRNDFIVQYENNYLQLAEIQPTTVYKKDTVIIEKHLTDEVKIKKNNKELIYTKLTKKPIKETSLKLPAITITKTSYIPPSNHPWRKFQFSKKQEKVKILKN